MTNPMPAPVPALTSGQKIRMATAIALALATLRAAALAAGADPRAFAAVVEQRHRTLGCMRDDGGCDHAGRDGSL